MECGIGEGHGKLFLMTRDNMVFLGGGNVSETWAVSQHPATAQGLNPVFFLQDMLGLGRTLPCGFCCRDILELPVVCPSLSFLRAFS